MHTHVRYGRVVVRTAGFRKLNRLDLAELRHPGSHLREQIAHPTVRIRKVGPVTQMSEGRVCVCVCLWSVCRMRYVCVCGVCGVCVCVCVCRMGDGVCT